MQVSRCRFDLAFASDLYRDAKSVAPVVCVYRLRMHAGIYGSADDAPVTISCLEKLDTKS